MRTQRSAPMRSDARRNVEAIVAAATDRLAVDPDVSISEIAKAAGVGRVTLYGHFESRAALVAEVVRRAVADTERSLAELELDGDPAVALRVLMDATWALTHRYGAIVVAGEQALSPFELEEAHRAPVRRVERILRRGRRSGAFRTDMPLGWQVAAIQGVLHTAAHAVQRGSLDGTSAVALVSETALAIVKTPHAGPGR